MQDARHLLYVDSGSTDGSVPLARSLGIDTLELDPARPFSAARARNEGASRLRQLLPQLRYLQFVDGDCELCSGWLAAAVQFMETRADVAVVSGRLRERNPGASVYNMLNEFEWDLPTGEVRSCGGIAVMRGRAFEEVQGFRADLIAGEEPELCLRLRRRGWRIWRLTEDMAWHDSDMSHFAQWWKRELRAGHAFAEGVALHGGGPERHYAREYRSALFWGLGVPLATLLLLVWFRRPWALVPLMLYPVQILRLARRGARAPRDNWLRALFLVLGKFPAALGVLRFHLRRALGR
jgi:GT2 family glycosyltransferase